MTPLTLMFLITAFFLALKAVEHRGQPTGLAAFCSVGAWVAFAVTLVLLLVTGFAGD